MSKKKTRRSEAKYPALDHGLNLKTRFEQVDMDYVNQLPESWTDPKTGKKYNPKQYLNDFIEESVHASFDKKKRIHKKKKIEDPRNKNVTQLQEQVLEVFDTLTNLINNANIKASSKVKLKKIINQAKLNLKKQVKKELVFILDVYKKEAYDSNNSRNRCILTRAKASGRYIGFEDIPESYIHNEDVEDQLINGIDLKFSEEFQNSQNGSDDTGEDSN